MDGSRDLVPFSIVGLLLVGGAVLAAHATAAARTPTLAASGAESVVEGTIARTNLEATRIVLTNGLELTVPLTVPVLHTSLTPRRPIKAYYVHVGDQNVVTMIIAVELTPGAGA